MSTLLMDARCVTSDSIPSYYHRSHVLKSKENVFKAKCNRALKKKLKKYKLRKDGQEDQEIIDVSKTLISSLRIKSPNGQQSKAKQTQYFEFEDRPNNYLFKMVRLRKTVSAVETSLTDSKQIIPETSEDSVISLTSKCNQDQDKKQMDAFKLLMDSRNKSIGSNSPGKDKSEDDSKSQEKVDKKELKAKRILSLQKMAQAKGALNNEKLEEYREECVKGKMEKRAKRLKKMIVGVALGKEKKNDCSNTNGEVMRRSLSPCSIEKATENKKSVNNVVASLTTIDLFEDSVNSSITPITKIVSKEDKEFLDKLAPSIRKKENMLCYFQKISKDSDNSQNNSDNEQLDNNQFIIKVKLKPKNLMKAKNRKPISNENKNLIESPTKIVKVDPSETNETSQKRKRNTNNKIDKEKVSQMPNISELCDGETRPKRSSKRPVKYADEIQLTSSDEEFHIFTPKKKRREKLENEVNVKLLNTKQIKEEKSKESQRRAGVQVTQTKKKESMKKTKKTNNDHSMEPSRVQSKLRVVQKKAMKLAPIFIAKQQLDVAALEAKQKFLHSEVPRKLKKNTYKQTINLSSDEFQTVIHVQQNTMINRMDVTKNVIDIKYLHKARDDKELELQTDDNLFKHLLSLSALSNAAIPLYKQNVDTALQEIKKSYPKFPVYRTYHLLKGKSKGEFKDCVYPELDNSVEIFNNMADITNVNPDKLTWTDKYRPTSEKQIIGNFEGIKELRRWLITWTEDNSKSKNSKDNGSDSCEFYQSDADSTEAVKYANNLLIITGSVGTGKTLSVYAIAAELSIKVLEVNASTKRTGKKMLQDLQEATQSHKVNRGKNVMECSQKNLAKADDIDTKIKVIKKRGRKKKIEVSNNNDLALQRKDSNEPTVRQENIRTGMSLILIDDADIVFDQDDGFCSAITQLIQTSKRPVILVTSSLTCPHLQKFLTLAKIIKMRPYLPRMLGTWLDIMCLVDNDFCCPGLGAKTLDYFKGDMRKTINYLQFYMTSHNILNKVDYVQTSQGQDIISKVNTDDESSCISWTENVGWGEKNVGVVNINPEDAIQNYFMKKLIELQHSWDSVNNIWWSLPNLLNYAKDDELVSKYSSKTHNSEVVDKLNTIASAMDFISTNDYFNNWQSATNTHVSDILSRPWHTIESPSVVDTESFAQYDKHNEVMNNISHELMTKSIVMFQRTLGCENKTDIQFPSMTLQRERNIVVARHKTLTNFLNPSSALYRRALALDYWPSCRSICRMEKTKTDSNNKRNNRFCHYLKSLNVLCKNDYFDNLSESLHFKSS